MRPLVPGPAAFGSLSAPQVGGVVSVRGSPPAESSAIRLRDGPAGDDAPGRRSLRRARLVPSARKDSDEPRHCHPRARRDRRVMKPPHR